MEEEFCNHSFISQSASFAIPCLQAKYMAKLLTTGTVIFKNWYYPLKEGKRVVFAIKTYTTNCAIRINNG